jgi:hypothetical protein
MKIDKDRMSALKSLTTTSSQGPWKHNKGRVTTESGQLVAYVCEPSKAPDFQQVANGEFIAEIHNNAAQLLTIISDQQWTIKRLVSRVLKLESEVYENQSADL